MLAWPGVCCRFAYAQLMTLPLTIYCSSKSRLVHLPSWFTFLVLAHPGSPGQNPEGHKMVVVVVVVEVVVFLQRMNQLWVHATYWAKMTALQQVISKQGSKQFT